MATVTTSKQFSLNLSDLWKGLIMAVLVPAATIITQSLDAGTLTFNWKAIVIAALSGFIGYIIKNFLTPPAIVVKNVDNEMIDKVKDGEASVSVNEH